MIAPVVILPPTAAVGIEARSKVERQALFHIAGTGLWARNGATVRLAPVLGSLILSLAAARGRTLAYGAIIDAIWGDDPEGGPLDPVGLCNVHRSKSKDDLAALGIGIEIWWGCGFALKVKRIRVAPRQAGHVFPPATTVHWLGQVEIMLERGSSVRAAAKAVNRSHVSVLRALGRIEPKSGPSPTRPRSAEERRMWRLRREARAEAAETGVPLHQIYERWNCLPVQKSVAWDQRRAASKLSEVRP